MTAARRSVDVLLVSLGTTLGLRAADDQLAQLLRAEGLDVEVARPPEPRPVRTLALTDLVQAHACGVAARAALRDVEPRAIIYCSTTAAMCWPRPGAIRFDALAQRTRPGHHGPWQRPLERRRLREATLLLPYASASLEGAAAQQAERAVVVPVAMPAAAHDAAADDAVGALLRPLAERGLRAVAVTYAADLEKKGVARTVAAFSAVRRAGEALLVAGHAALPAELAAQDGIVDVGRLPADVFRALIRAVGVLALAPRREDYGQVQLEALAEGARVVTTAAPGPYAALPLIRELWPEQVVDADADAAQLGRALRAAVDAAPDPQEHIRASQAVAPWSPEATATVVRERVIPALLHGARPA